MSNDSALAIAFEDLRNTRFPGGSELDRVSDLHARLAEYDGYVAGVASSILKGKRRDAPRFDEEFLTEMEQALRQNPEGSDELVQYIKYLRKLKEILRVAGMIASDRNLPRPNDAQS